MLRMSDAFTAGRVCHLPRKPRLSSLIFDRNSEVSGQNSRFLQVYQQEDAKSSLASSNSLVARSGCGIWEDGVQSDISRGGQNWRADKRRWVQTFGAEMDACEQHITRAEHVIEELELSAYTCRNSKDLTVTAELIIVGILSLIIDADVRSFDKRAYARDGTQRLLADIESDVGEYERVRSLLRQEDYGLLFPET